MNTPERLLAWAGAVVLAVAFTWPLTVRMGSVGRLDSGDARYSIWNVAWVARALTEQPASLYDANIFYPERQTLAYSEPNLVAGAIAAPVWRATHNPHAASNWVILCSFVLSAVTTYLLARRLSQSPFGAAVAAISFAYCGFVFSHLAHVQLLMTFSLPLVLLAMHAFVDTPTAPRAAWLGASLATSALACGYYGIYAGLATALGVVWFGVASGRWRRWQYWGLALVAAGLAIAITWPFFQPLAGTDFPRGAEDARVFSANWQAYLASPKVINQWLLTLIGEGSWREVLFPGWLAILFGLFAVATTFRPHGAAPAPPRSVVGYYCLLAALAAWASLGPDARLYAALQDTVPFFTLLRASARFGILVTLAFSVLAAIGAAALSRRLTERRRLAFVLVTLAFALISARVGDLHLQPAPVLPEAYRRLAGMPRAPVAEFPYFVRAAERHRHTEYMLFSTYHWQPLVNGYSDYIPRKAFRDAVRLATFPDPEAWTVLREKQVRYVVIHWDKYEDAERNLVVELVESQRSFLRPIVEDPTVGLFEVLSPPVTAAAAATLASELSVAEAAPRRR